MTDIFLPEIQIIEPKKLVWEYRAYYKDDGSITQYRSVYKSEDGTLSSEPEESLGNYIVVTPEQFSENNMHAIVKDGAYVHPSSFFRVFTFVKNSEGTVRTSKYDITVLVGNNDTEFNLWHLTAYDN